MSVLGSRIASSPREQKEAKIIEHYGWTPNAATTVSEVFECHLGVVADSRNDDRREYSFGVGCAWGQS
jgi:hypothetical protein